MNMSYCRFHNTALDVSDCIDALNEGDTMSASEASAGKRMFREMLGFCLDNDIVTDYDKNAIDKLFNELKEED